MKTTKLEKTRDFFICHCPDCTHEWVEYFMVPMNLTAFANRLKGMAYCPGCAARHCGILMGNRFKKAQKRLIANTSEWK